MKGLGFYNNDFLIIKSDFDLIAESITRIIMTNYNERVGRPTFGGNLKYFIFEQMSPETIASIKMNIKKQVTTFEPRANISTLDVIPDENNNTINIKLGFTIKGGNVQDERFINLSFQMEK